MKQWQRASAARGAHKSAWQGLGGRLAAMSGLLTSAVAVAQDYDYVYLSQFGNFATLYGLTDVAVDPGNHNILVVDFSHVRVFTSDGTYLHEFDGGGGGIAVDAGNHHIVVGDLGNHGVQVFDENGTYLSQFGSEGTGNGQFSSPGGIAIDPVSHNIVVADVGNHRIQIFSSNGVYLGQFGLSQVGSYGYFLTVDPNTRNILVADELNDNVQIFSATGTLLSQFGSAGTGNGQFDVPLGIALDPISRNILVTDLGNYRVQVFDENGTYLSQFGRDGTDNGQFRHPLGIAVDPVSHQVVVTDNSNDRAQLFVPASLPPTPACGPTQVSLSTTPLTARLSQAFLFSAQAGITAPFGGTVSFFVDGTTTVACTANMRDVSAACLHTLTLGTHDIVAQYSGDGHNTPGCSVSQTVTVIADGDGLPTNITCTASPNPAEQGEPVVTTCSVSADAEAGADSTAAASRPDSTTAPSGYVTFSQGTNVIAYEPVFFGTAVYTTVLAGGSYSLSASYSGDGENATSTAQLPIEVQAPADDIFYGGFDIPPS